MYQAAMLNKLLQASGFKLDLYENVKKKANSSAKSKKIKTKLTSKPPEYLVGTGTGLSESGLNTPGSFSSINTGNNHCYADGRQHPNSYDNEDDAQNALDNSFGRRTSRREKKPTAKVDLGYEEPKPIKGVKLTGNAREILRK
jgi:hypothetical protein